MSEMITYQARVFGWAFIYGAVLTAVYHLLIIIRRIIPHNRFLVDVQDILFWTVFAGETIKFIYTYDSGTMRGYSVLGYFLGFISYTVLIRFLHNASTMIKHRD